MKKRWLCLYVENEIGVLAMISGLFSGKAYNLNSLTVGVTEDETISRMTIGLTSDDQTFEQIKKQLNRSVEVIKVIDYTDAQIHMKELLFIKITQCTQLDKMELFQRIKVFDSTIVEDDKNTIVLECVQRESKNDELLELLEERFCDKIEIVRGGSVAIESIKKEV